MNSLRVLLVTTAMSAAFVAAGLANAEAQPWYPPSTQDADVAVADFIALPESDGAVGHSFGLEFDGIQVKSITEVSGLKMERDVVELKQNSDGKYSVKKLPGNLKSGDVTLTRPVTDDHAFDAWFKDSHVGKNVAVVLYDSEGKMVKRYTMTNAFPRSLEVGSSQVNGATVLTEKLVLTYERVEVQGP